MSRIWRSVGSERVAPGRRARSSRCTAPTGRCSASSRSTSRSPVCGPRDEDSRCSSPSRSTLSAPIEAVQVAAAAARDRACAAPGCSTSRPRSSTLDTADTVLENVGAGIPGGARVREGGGLPRARRQLLQPRGLRAGSRTIPGSTSGLTDADLDLLFVPEFEIGGCYLIEDTVATALVGDCSKL